MTAAEARARRRELRLQRKVLAQRIGVAPRTLISWEWNERNPTPEHYRAWLRALELNTNSAEAECTAAATRGALDA